MDASLDNSKCDAQALVRAALESLDVACVSDCDLRRLRAQLQAAREAQGFRISSANARSNARLENERRRLYRAQARIGELRAEALDAESERLAGEIRASEERIAEEAQRETVEAYLERRARETQSESRLPWEPR
jgi:hypothetical protein